MSSKESNLWYNAMRDEIDSMASNQVWDLVELPAGVKVIGCRWVFKTKKDSEGNIERHKTRLAGKGFTQREGINYRETFSPVSKKDSHRVYTRPDIAFAVGVLGRYQSNPVIGYSDPDFAGCVDS
ncbi:uncharacterized protein LOC114404924 [Glycine soja]|uniref:uncharacterized mitochondrial protein AtMg00820-like n=1 Tax=Glycine max TaxID=3847 RepID=UPI000E21B5FB|nr:uncharacterized mitochondrial protein AtMg00820-like [Glycine max]XP_028223448.1 uncharacterized protein LOC114404924 [Glycine soja]|eukprot:XP_025983779.1 uncharacterized protein LOC113001191 [Glycine max]